MGKKWGGLLVEGHFRGFTDMILIHACLTAGKPNSLFDSNQCHWIPLSIAGR